MRKLFAVSALALFLLDGCGGAGTKIADIAQSPTGQVLLAGVENFTPGISRVVAKVNAGLAAAETDKQLLCGGMSWAHTLFKVAAPIAGVDEAGVAAETAGMTAAEAICTGTTTDLDSAVVTVARAYSETTAALAAGGVPVTPAPPPVVPPAT